MHGYWLSASLPQFAHVSTSSVAFELIVKNGLLLELCFERLGEAIGQISKCLDSTKCGELECGG